VGRTGCRACRRSQTRECRGWEREESSGRCWHSRRFCLLEVFERTRIKPGVYRSGVSVCRQRDSKAGRQSAVVSDAVGDGGGGRGERGCLRRVDSTSQFPRRGKNKIFCFWQKSTTTTTAGGRTLGGGASHGHTLMLGGARPAAPSGRRRGAARGVARAGRRVHRRQTNRIHHCGGVHFVPFFPVLCFGKTFTRHCAIAQTFFVCVVCTLLEWLAVRLTWSAWVCCVCEGDAQK
jgi:hypothetical protein